MTRDAAGVIQAAAAALLPEKERVLIAIDGRCAAGKTALAARLQAPLDATVLHMDDFFLRPAQRTPERLAQAGENVDHERFLREALLPLREGRAFVYRPYDCKSQTLTAPVAVRPKRVGIVEGSYCCHPALWDYYDLHIFLDIDPEEQLRRLALRNPDSVRVFQTRWIPLEEAYFAAFQVKERCECF